MPRNERRTTNHFQLDTLTTAGVLEILGACCAHSDDGLASVNDMIRQYDVLNSSSDKLEDSDEIGQVFLHHLKLAQEQCLCSKMPDGKWRLGLGRPKYFEDVYEPVNHGSSYENVGKLSGLTLADFGTAQALKSKPSSREKSTVHCNIAGRITLADLTDRSEFSPPKATVRQAVTPPRATVRPVASPLSSAVRPAVDCCQCKRPIEPEILELLKMDLDAPCLLHAMVYLCARIKPKVFEEMDSLKPKSPVSKEKQLSRRQPMKSSQKVKVRRMKKCLECGKRATRIKSRMLKDYKLENLLKMLELMNQKHYESKLFKCNCSKSEREALGADWCKCFESLSSETCHPITSEDHSRKHTKSQCSCSGNVCKYQKPPPPKAKADKKNRKSCNPTTCNEEELCEPGPSSSSSWLSEAPFEQKRKSRRRSTKRERKRRESRRKKRKHGSRRYSKKR